MRYPFAFKSCYLTFMIIVMCSCGPTDRDYAYKKTRTQIAQLQTACEMFRYDCGRYPSPDEGLAILTTSNSVPGWRDHYLVRPIPTDFWGTPYRYRLDGKPSIVSAGKDKVFDTADDISQ